MNRSCHLTTVFARHWIGTVRSSDPTCAPLTRRSREGSHVATRIPFSRVACDALSSSSKYERVASDAAKWDARNDYGLGVIDPSTTARRAPVALGTFEGTPSSVAAPSSANATASFA